MEPLRTPPPLEPPRWSVGRVVGINLLVLVAANVLAMAYATVQAYDDVGAFAVASVAIALTHVAFALASGLVLVFFARYRRVGMGMLLGALVVLVVGVSFCFGGVVVLDGI